MKMIDEHFNEPDKDKILVGINFLLDHLNYFSEKGGTG